MSRVFCIKSRLRDYEVHFVQDLATAVGDQKSTEAFLIIDAGLPFCFQARIRERFLKERVIVIRVDEKIKTLKGCARLLQELVDRGVRKDNILFVVGGGTVEDLAGFVSMALFRGVDWVFCPTTLLAQADSCIGSKSSINFGKYKNLLGSFYPPSKVLVDLHFLDTLPLDEIKSGIGEILHFYLVAGQERRARFLISRYDHFLKNPKDLKPFVLASLKIKKAVIERDELDKGERNLFNYGHTFAHALESLTNYKLCHGQAVIIGMDISNYLSYKLDYISKDMYIRMNKVLIKNWPKFDFTHLDLNLFFKCLSKDKKNIGNRITMILTAGPGKMIKESLPLNNFLRNNIALYFDLMSNKSNKIV